MLLDNNVLDFPKFPSLALDLARKIRPQHFAKPIKKMI